jgi:DNA excision repair protein ERCC-2
LGGCIAAVLQCTLDLPVTSKPRLIPLSVREFSLPVPRIGSIEAHSGYGRGSEEGQEIHLRVQASREKANANYRSEVAVRHTWERGGYRFLVGGRMDGLFESVGGSAPHIEEIKSGFNLLELSEKLAEGSETHPYCLQLLTYGYIHWAQSGEMPRLSLHVVSSRTYDFRDVEIKLDVPAYEAWAEKRLDELVEEAKRAEARAKRRKKAAGELPFPFTQARPGQEELIRTVEEGLAAKERLLVQAPTGLGKTVGVLYPALKEALGRGQGVVYVTPKNSQHSVAEDAVERLQEAGSRIRPLTVTAKGKICLKAEPLCNPEFCEYARDHYTKVHEAGLPEILSKKKKLTARVFRTLAESYQVCPFELQLEGAKDADVVICDYNYVFSPRSSMGSLASAGLGQNGKANLVIDEAHNLPARGMDYFSPTLSTVALERLRPFVQELPDRFKDGGLEILDRCLEIVNECRPEGVEKSAPIEPDPEPFLEHESRIRDFLTRYLQSDVEIQPKDVVLRLHSYWTEFTASLEAVTGAKRPEFFTTFQVLPGGGAVRITCCDASEMLKPCFDEFEHVVGFSATLKPFDYYAKLSGLDPEKVRTVEFQSPFSRAKRKLLIIPQISTKYSDRARNYPKVADTIERLIQLRPGNYFAFFPSFEFLERALEQFRAPEGFTVIRQRRDMKAAEIEEIVDHLKGASAPTVVFAVQGGVFSEGVDYPGEAVIGAFVVGPPLPSFDLEREGMRAYYQERYGAGFEYAYAFPAMAKAVQAAGRVIRSETDRGLIVLMDARFLQKSYTQSMPTDWFTESPRELVSESILKEVRDFWDER